MENLHFSGLSVLQEYRNNGSQKLSVSYQTAMLVSSRFIIHVGPQLCQYSSVSSPSWQQLRWVPVTHRRTLRAVRVGWEYDKDTIVGLTFICSYWI